MDRVPLAKTPRLRGGGIKLIAVCIIGLLIAANLLYVIVFDQPESARSGKKQTAATIESSTDKKTRFTTRVRKPAGPPRIRLGIIDVSGNELTASCSTCHATRVANEENRTVANLDEFHTAIKFNHGNVSCLSCHNSRDYDTLRLADGKPVEYVEVMDLCSQCHGPQKRDFDHGAHGGMNGYWDLNRGPRTRNNCVDCHDPHQPQFPRMRPTFKPRDRFLDRPNHQSTRTR